MKKVDERNKAKYEMNCSELKYWEYELKNTTEEYKQELIKNKIIGLTQNIDWYKDSIVKAKEARAAKREAKLKRIELDNAREELDSLKNHIRKDEIVDGPFVERQAELEAIIEKA